MFKVMHETHLVNKVIENLRGREIRKAKLRLGRMHSRADVFSELFAAQTKGTDMEGFELEVEEVPVKINCPCGFMGRVAVMEHVHFVRCPKCNGIVDPATGNEIELVY